MKTVFPYGKQLCITTGFPFKAADSVGISQKISIKLCIQAIFI